MRSEHATVVLRFPVGGKKARDHSQQVRKQYEEKRPGQKGEVFLRLLSGTEHVFNRVEKELKSHKLEENVHRRLIFGDYGLFLRVMLSCPQADKQYEQNYEYSAQNMVVLYETGQGKPAEMFHV